ETVNPQFAKTGGSVVKGQGLTKFASEGDLAADERFDEKPAALPVELARRAVDACLGARRFRHRGQRADGPFDRSGQRALPAYQGVGRRMRRVHALSLCAPAT